MGEFCRFVNDSTVLLAWTEDYDLADSARIITRQHMEVNLRILEQFRNRNGRALKVIKVPAPGTEFRDHVVTSKHSYDRMLIQSARTCTKAIASVTSLRRAPSTSSSPMDVYSFQPTGTRGSPHP